MATGWKRAVLGVVLRLSFSGCATGIVGTRLLGGGLASALRPGLIPVTEPVIGPPSGLKACAEPGEELTLGRALWLAQIYNPELAEASYEVRARDAKIIQAGLSFPLQVFDRNQGNVLAAQSNVAKGEQGSRAAWVRVQTALASSYNAILSAYAEAASMRNDVIPALQRAFDAFSTVPHFCAPGN